MDKLSASTKSTSQQAQRSQVWWRAATCGLMLLVLGALLGVHFLATASAAPSAPIAGLSSTTLPNVQVLCVDDNGGATGAPCANPTAYTSIQPAINDAVTGDEVRVAAGLYTGTGATVVNLNKDLTLTGGYPGGAGGWTTPGNHTLTVIDGQGQREGINVPLFNLNTVAQNLSVVNGGVVLSVTSTLSNNMPVNARSLALGAGGTLGGSAPFTVTNVLTWSNSTMSGTGSTDILPGAQLNFLGDIPQIQGSRTVNNYGTATWSNGSFFNTASGTFFNNHVGAKFTVLGVSKDINGGAVFNNFGTFTKQGTGTTRFSFETTLNNSGTADVQAGTLTVSRGSSTGAYNIAAGATLRMIGGDHTFQASSTISGAGQVVFAGATHTIDGAYNISGPTTINNAVADFNSVGANTATVMGVLTQTGNGTLGGTRVISITSRLDWDQQSNTRDAGRTDILPGAQLNFTGHHQVQAGRVVNNYSAATQSGTAQLSLNPGTFNNRQGATYTTLNNNSIDGGGTFNNMGTFIKQSGTGTTTISCDFTNSGVVEVQSGLLHYIFNNTYVQTGGATRMVGGNLQVTNPFQLQGGTLEGTGTVTGSVNNTGGTVSPGASPGLITITGDYTQGAGGTLNIELGGLTPITEFDRLDVGGQANLNGTLNATLINGFVPSPDDSFRVMNYASRNGVFSTYNGPPRTLQYNPDNLTLIPTTSTCTLSFSDVPQEHTFYANIRCLACRGIISGYSDGTFRPGNDVTRGQIAKMVSNSAGFIEPVTGQSFEDVPIGSPFYEFIERLYRRGHMGGYPCGLRDTEPCNPPDNRPYFRPNENATRGQISKIVSNASGNNDPVSGQFYTDVTEDNPFYTEIMRLTGRGVMSGYPCGTVPHEPCDSENRPYFRWGANVTRGQASKIVANTFFPGCQTP